jgi:transposase, IS5 family
VTDGSAVAEKRVISVERRGPAVCNGSNDKGGKGEMTKTPISLQDLRRSLYVKAKAEPTWRFWGLYVHVCKLETIREAYEMARSNNGAPGIDGVTFEAIEESGAESFLNQIPTDSSLLGDGARVLTRTMKKIEAEAGTLKRKVRNRTRSISKRVVAIATASRHKGEEGEAKRRKQYKELLRYSRQILNDTKRVLAEVEEMSAKKKNGLRGLCEHLSEMAGRVRQVVKQTKVRVFDGITQMPGKIVSLFEPHSEIIRKGKASKPTEFGKLVQVQETENQIITHYDVFDQRPSDRDLLLGAVETHERVLGRVPQLATADAGYYSRAQEQAVEDKGVKWVAVPNRSTKSAERKKKEHSRWFRNAQRWRTGCEGRISVLKRRHGLSRCRYRGIDGMKRWVGLGVMADTLIGMGNVLAART